jgi:hypothetical protein
MGSRDLPPARAVFGGRVFAPVSAVKVSRLSRRFIATAFLDSSSPLSLIGQHGRSRLECLRRRVILSGPGGRSETIRLRGRAVKTDRLFRRPWAVQIDRREWRFMAVLKQSPMLAVGRLPLSGRKKRTAFEGGSNEPPLRAVHNRYWGRFTTSLYPTAVLTGPFG